MAFSKTWNINKYRSEFESDEHWELRKKFMETHKDKYPEDKVVCLARVFFNVEFLGCRYPQKTMELIATLSEGVADEHREKQKGKLKRTFVQASDAANSKITRSSSSAEPVKKLSKMSEEDHKASYSCFVHESLVTPTPPEDPGPFPGFILFENCNPAGIVVTCPISILIQSTQKYKNSSTVSFDFLPPPQNDPLSITRVCQVSINNQFLASASGSTPKEAKLNAATAGLNVLRKFYYTIQGKCAFYSEDPLIGKNVPVRDSDTPLSQDNIGSKMMMKMGWTGSGLGKKQQGIQDPVKAASKIVQRSGLGCVDEKQFHAKYREIFKDYIASGSENDLVFTPDFLPDERKVLHMLAQRMQLKTRSYGKNNERHLVVYKSLSLPMLLETLLSCGGENDKYLLIPPTGSEDLETPSGEEHMNEDACELPLSDRNVQHFTETTSSMAKTTQNAAEEQQQATTGVELEDSSSKSVIEVIHPASDENLSRLQINTVQGLSDICSPEEDLDTHCNPTKSADTTGCDQNKRDSPESVDLPDDPDIKIMDEILQTRINHIQELSQKIVELETTYQINNSFQRKDRRRYVAFAVEFHQLTGIYLKDITTADDPVYDALQGKNVTSTKDLKKKLIKKEKYCYDGKCKVVGATVVRCDSRLKKLCWEKIKKAFLLTSENDFSSLESKQKLSKIAENEFLQVGCNQIEELIKNYDDIESLAHLNTINKINAIVKTLEESHKHCCNPNSKENGDAVKNRIDVTYVGNNSENNNKTNRVIKSSKNELNFVKENELPNTDEGSGIEYSDEEYNIDDNYICFRNNSKLILNPKPVQLKGKKSTPKASKASTRFSRLQEKKLKKAAKRIRNMQRAQLKQSLVTDVNCTTGLIDENLQSRNILKSREISEFCSQLSSILNGVSPDRLTTLKSEILGVIKKSETEHSTQTSHKDDVN